VNAFLDSKAAQLDTGKLSPRSFRDYHRTCARLVKHFGRHRRVDDLRPDDFAKLRKEIAATRGVVALGNEVQRVRTVFKYAFEEGKIEKLRTMTSGKPKRRLTGNRRTRRSATQFARADRRAFLGTCPGYA
jgi:hypothetical protein